MGTGSLLRKKLLNFKGGNMSFIKKDLGHEQLKDMVLSLEAQLVHLYDEKARYGNPEDLNKSIESLTDQLQTFYRLQEEHGEFQAVAASLKGLEEQLASFYQDVGTSVENDEDKIMIHNLEKQVISLIDERNEIVEKMRLYKEKMQKIKNKSRELGAALFETALFENKKVS